MIYRPHNQPLQVRTNDNYKVTYICTWTNSIFLTTLFKQFASSFRKKVADFSGQSCRRVSSVVGAYWNPWARHNYPFCWAKNSVGYLPYTKNSRAIKVKELTALHIVRSAGISDGDINSNISLMIGIFL